MAALEWIALRVSSEECHLSAVRAVALPLLKTCNRPLLTCAAYSSSIIVVKASECRLTNPSGGYLTLLTVEPGVALGVIAIEYR
jgi:hypothetical protein